MITTTITRYDVSDFVAPMIELSKNDSFDTVYATSKLVNLVLKKLEINKTIAPQMMYNYHSKGKFVLTLESVSEWITKYINNNIHKF